MTYVVIGLLVIALSISIFKNIKLGMAILRIEDTLEECLDVIDDKYENMTEILSRPLFYDSPEVRQVVSDIRAVRDALHAIAFSLTQNIEDHEKEIDSEKEKEN